MPIKSYRALIGLSLAVLLVSCSTTPTATTDFDPGFDFSGVHKIAIQPIHRTVASQSVLSDMQIGRVNGSLTAELERRGFQVVANNSDADMFLAWHLVTQERTDVRTYNTMSARYTTCWHCGPMTTTDVRVTQYTQGTLIVDLIDPVRLQSVWRSVIQSRLREQSDPQAAAERRAEAAAATFAEFPPA